MNFERLIILPIGFVALAGGLFVIKAARRYRLRRDKAKAIKLHREMRKLRKAINEVDNGLARPRVDVRET